MAVSNINGSLFTGLSALDGKTLSSLSHVDGFAITSTPTIYGVADTSIGFWYKADAQSYVNNDPVGTLVDSSSAGNNATQSTSANKPTFKTNEINSLPAISFDGTNDSLDLASGAWDNWSTSTMFAVLKPAGSGNRTIFCGQTAGLQYRINSSTKQELVKTAVVNIGASTTALSTSVYSQVNATFNAGSAYAFRLSSASDGGSSTAATLSGNTNCIGRNDPSGDEFFSGLIAELIVWKRVLSGSEIASVESGLNSKYGV